jgi:hypothetical protein
MPVVEESDRRGAAILANADLVSAQRELEASSGNCAAACRALGSLDRAAGRLCSLASTREDQRTCDDAKTKLISARNRVRTACGSCPGGVTVEATAPVPSL